MPKRKFQQGNSASGSAVGEWDEQDEEQDEDGNGNGADDKQAGTPQGVDDEESGLVTVEQGSDEIEVARGKDHGDATVVPDS